MRLTERYTTALDPIPPPLPSSPDYAWGEHGLGQGVFCSVVDHDDVQQLVNEGYLLGHGAGGQGLHTLSMPVSQSVLGFEHHSSETINKQVPRVYICDPLHEIIIKIIDGAPSRNSPMCLQRHKDMLISSHTHAHTHHKYTYTHTLSHTYYKYMLSW